MAKDRELSIPMPLQIIVDDVVWWSGQDGSQFNQPFRTGIGREHQAEDYLALATLGKGLGMKILAGFVLCEWDRTNLLSTLPSATWMGRDWDNAGTSREAREEAADIIRREHAAIEIAMHGIGHEFWIDGKMERAEFHNELCEMRGRDEIRRHLEYFLLLMEQYGLGPQPRSFIPPALKHSFGNGEEGIQRLLHEFGIRNVATRFAKTRQFSEPMHSRFTWECNVLLVNRGKAECPWNGTACEPVFAFDGPFLTLHWANILHRDPAKNPTVIAKWIDFVSEGMKRHHLLPARDMQSCLSQYLHRTLSTIQTHAGRYAIDLTWKKNLPEGLMDHTFCIETAPDWADLDIVGATSRCLSRSGEAILFQLTALPQTETILIQPVRQPAIRP